jgi:CBS domain-containing protein
MTSAGEFCNRRVVIARRDEMLSNAARRMLDEHVGCLVVVTGGNHDKLEPIGVLTDRDIVAGVLAHPSRDFQSLAVGDVMTPEIVAAREQESLEDALERMRSFGIRRLPVVANDGSLQGIITFDDLVEFLQEQISDLASLLSRERKHEADVRPRAR